MEWFYRKNNHFFHQTSWHLPLLLAIHTSQCPPQLPHSLAIRRSLLHWLPLSHLRRQPNQNGHRPPLSFLPPTHLRPSESRQLARIRSFRNISIDSGHASYSQFVGPSFFTGFYLLQLLHLIQCTFYLQAHAKRSNNL